MKDKEKLLKDFFNGKLSKKEAGAFLDWFLSDEGEKELSDKIENIWDEEIDQDTENWSSEGIFDKIQSTKENQRFLVQNVNTSNWWRNNTLKIAASVALVLTSVTAFFILDNQVNGDEKPIKTCEIEKANPTGQKSTIFLADGSKVILNSASSVCYSENFLEKRHIHLEGEAFFDVKKDPERPFVVYTKDLATTALGTSFNIKAYDNQTTEVALVSGKVSVEDVFRPENKVILNPGELAARSIEEKDSTLSKSTFDYIKKIAWKDGVIHFNDTPLDEAVKTLERWYGVTITYENRPPAGLYCTGEFKNDYLSNVLESIGFTLGFKYEIDNKTVKLNFKPKNQ